MKKIFILALILILFFSFASVSASDINETLVQDDISIDDENIEIDNSEGSLEDNITNNIEIDDSEIAESSDENVLGLSNVNDDELSADRATDSFTVLNVQLDDWKKSTFTWTHDYTYFINWDDDYINGIVIDKDLTIDGAGHSIDGSNAARAFNCKGTVTFKNIHFNNFKTLTLVGSGTIVDCTFSNCGGINWKGSITNCQFSNCKVSDLIYATGAVKDCTFSNCGAYGKLISGCNNGVINCVFDSCSCKDAIVYNIRTVSNCTFNSCNLYCIYWNYDWEPFISGCRFNNQINDWYKFISSTTKMGNGLSVKLPYGDITVEDIAIDAVTMNQGASGFVRLYVDDVLKDNVSVKNLKFKGLENLDAGSHVIKFVYDGDKLFNPITLSKNINVVKANSTISITNIKNIGGEIAITIALGKRNTGNATLTIDNKTITAVVSNGVATFKSRELSPGKYNATFNYQGDKNYYSSNLDSEIEIPLIDPELKISVKDNYIGQNPLITVESSKLDATVNININNKKYVRTLSNGATVIELTNLQLGRYPISVVFDGDENYMPQTINSTFEYTKIPVDFTIDVSNSTSETQTKVTFKTNVAGTAVISIGSTSSQTIQLRANVAGSASFNHLSAGSHFASIKFTPTNTNYKDINTGKSFIVSKAVIPVKVNIPTVYEGNNLTVKVSSSNLYFAGFPRVTLTLDNTITKYVITSYNTPSVDFGILSPGIHKLNIFSDNGNSNYEKHNETIDVIILNKIIPEINCTVKNITYGQSTTVDLISNVTGRAIVTLDNDKNETVILTANKKSIIYFYSVSAGKHVITVTFTPTNKIYNQTFIQTEYFVSKKDATVKFNVKDFYYGDSSYIEVKPNAKGKITISAGGIVKTNSLTSTSWTNISLGNLDVGNYPVTIKFDAGSNYNVFTGTANFSVTKIKSFITLSDAYSTDGSNYILLNTVYGNNKHLYVTVKDADDNYLKNVVVLISINGKTVKETTDDHGKIEINPSDYVPGIYNIDFSLEDIKYDNSPATAKINVSKANPTFNTADWNKVTTYGTTSYLSFGYTDSKMKGATLIVDLNGEKTVTLDSDGKASLPLNGLSPNTYNVKIVFKGNSYFNEDVKTLKVTVKKATPKITAKAKTFKKSVKTKKYSITLKNNLNKAMKNTKVTIKVNKKTYTAKTNSKGVATFKITKLNKKGTFKATVTYKGSSYYNKVTKKVNIKIK